MIPNTSAGDLAKPRYFISQPVLGNDECRILDRHNLEVDETLKLMDGIGFDMLVNVVLLFARAKSFG